MLAQAPFYFLKGLVTAVPPLCYTARKILLACFCQIDRQRASYSLVAVDLLANIAAYGHSVAAGCRQLPKFLQIAAKYRATLPQSRKQLILESRKRSATVTLASYDIENVDTGGCNGRQICGIGKSLSLLIVDLRRFAHAPKLGELSLVHPQSVALLKQAVCDSQNFCTNLLTGSLL